MSGIYHHRPRGVPFPLANVLVPMLQVDHIIYVHAFYLRVLCLSVIPYTQHGEGVVNWKCARTEVHLVRMEFLVPRWIASCRPVDGAFLTVFLMCKGVTLFFSPLFFLLRMKCMVAVERRSKQ